MAERLGRLANVILNEFAEHMAQRDVAFFECALSTTTARRRHIDHAGQFAARAAGPGDGRESHGLGRFDSSQHIGELPLVLMAMATSPACPCARTWRAKSSSKP